MGFMVTLKNIMGFGSSVLTYVQAHATMLAVVTAFSLTGIGTSYLKGRSDGYEKSQGQIALQDNKQMTEIYESLEQTRKSVERAERQQYLSNLDLSKLIRENINTKEIIYKELQSEPIILQGTCDDNEPILEYNSTLGVLDRAANPSASSGVGTSTDNPSS